MRKLVITVDGPAGSGKSTVAKLLAQKLSLDHLDSGKIYRTIAYLSLQMSLEDALVEVRKAKFNSDKVFFNGKDISQEIRKDDVGKKASEISRNPKVREVANEIQRQIAQSSKKGIVVDGRDAGTVVFPNANVKFFITASAAERARRKMKELEELGIKKSFDEVLKDILERDRQDKEREIAPLKIPDGAVVIDTTDLSPDQVVEKMLFIIKRLS